MSLKEFNKSFGITSTLIEEQEAFINRSNYFFDKFRKYLNEKKPLVYFNAFEGVCLSLGVNPQKVKVNTLSLSGYPSLHQILPESFLNTLKIWIALRKHFQHDDFAKKFDRQITKFLNHANVDLGVSYNDGMFYPKGEDVLDQDLINHSLQALAAYPNEDKDLRNALDNYRMGKKDGVIETCYRCMEGLAKQILSNNQTLIDNKADLLKKLNLSESWKSLLNMYIKFGNDYGRHANANRHTVTEEEVEAYLYETCILIRLLARSNPSI